MKNLKYYIALQPFFRERMGKWKVGDFFWLEDSPFYDTPNVFAVQYRVEPPDSAIWLPRTIDDSSEEARGRSLWGMLEGILGCKRGITDNRYCCSVFYKHEKSWYFGETPTEAILKALCDQEGIEVE